MATRASRAADKAREHPPGRWTGWIRNLWIAAFVAAAAYLAGTQIATPNRRTLQVLAAAVLVGAALRVSSFTSLLVFTLALPFPKNTTYGGTSLAFVLLIFIIWLMRISLRLEHTAGRSVLDLPVVALICAYLLSFSQIAVAEQLRIGLFNFFSALTTISVCYLVIHLTQTEKQLRQMVLVVLIMAVLIHFTAVFELLFPGRALIPGWIELTYRSREDYIRRGLEVVNIRVGGAIGDYELLAEFCAMMMIFIWFVLMQTRGWWKRSLLVGMLVLDVFVLFATVTRGAIVSLILAATYLTWKTRQRIRFHTFVIALAGILTSTWLILEFVIKETRSGNVLERLAKTEFQGVVPETRVGAWEGAWHRILERPILGHGPYYAFKEGVTTIYWPHNNYLFYWHLLGIIGLGAFLWILWRLWKATAGHAPNLGHPSYSRGLLLALRAMLVLFLIDQIKIDYLRNGTYAYWIWLFFGLIVATSRIAAKEAALAAPLTLPTAARRAPRPLPISAAVVR